MPFYIGLSSGTSMDAIDAALVEISPAKIALVAYREAKYSAPLKDLLDAVVAGERALTASDFGTLHVRIGQEFAAATCQLLSATGLAKTEISAIGSHGQTISHAPDAAIPYTLQLGDPSTIAARTGLITVGDFRGMDVALGGQGAPLVPPFHDALFARPGSPQAVVNIGGIANVTLLPGKPHAAILAFDTGPGNTLLDQWITKVNGESFDRDGAWARSGIPEQALLDLFLADAYFDRMPPKSTGREDFNLAWIVRMLDAAGNPPLPPANVQRSLLELTCLTVVSQIRRHLPGCERLILCGGGARNPLLVERMGALASPLAVVTADAYGVPSAAIEAMAFAWLAYRRLNELPGNLPSVTGASRPVLLGAVYSPR